MRLVIRSRVYEPIVEALEADWEVIRLPRTPDRWVLGEADLVSALVGADVLVTEADPVTAHVLASSPNLQAVIACRGNPVNVDMAAATAEGVLVINTPGRNATAVAELCVALMIMAARRVVLALEAVRTARWASAPHDWAYQTFQGTELTGKTVGLVGLGAVGREVAARLQGFRMNMLAFDPYVTQEVAQSVGVKLVPLDALLVGADFISIHIHVTPETAGMIGAREFALMKRSAYLINTARAGVIVETAMLDALRERRIAGAGLDVFHEEPLVADHPLLGLSNVVLLPHIGGATVDVIQHQWEIAAVNLREFREGRRPPCLCNPEVIKSLRRPRMRGEPIAR